MLNVAIFSGKFLSIGYNFSISTLLTLSSSLQCLKWFFRLETDSQHCVDVYFNNVALSLSLCLTLSPNYADMFIDIDTYICVEVDIKVGLEK